MSNLAPATKSGRRVLDMSGYQWLVMLAAWLGWGFDVFDSLLFNYVAPNAVPTLLQIPLGTEQARSATIQWVGILSSVLLLGWAVGGILFGRVADRIGRTRTLLLTMVIYAAGTAACAFATNIWMLLAFRVVASLGIGGEWAAGAAMVAEVVPEKRRVEAGAILYTAAPLGLFLASYVTFQIQGVLFKGDPSMAWRYVFLCGLFPAAVAMLVRVFVREPEKWKVVAAGGAHPTIGELFSPALRKTTLSGLGMASIALLTWWSCNAFIPTIASGLAAVEAKAQGLQGAAIQSLVEGWKAQAGNWFNLGGLIGTLLTVPMSRHVGRKPMFTVYFLLAGISIMAAFGLDLSPQMRLFMYFPIGLTVFGVFGSFTYYLPELYPTRLRGTGAGFCYNAGRVVAAAGPPLVGSIAAMGANSLATAQQVLFWVGVVPLAGLLLIPTVVETRGRVLET